MRSLYIGLVAFFLMMTTAWADTPFEPLLDKVTLQFNAEQWVTTKTALVTAGVNASVSDNAVERIQSEVLARLNQLSNKAEWHIVSFNRNLDQSGLERISISAQVRLPSSELGGLRDKAKAISKPGETFTIDNVEFTPSADELRDGYIALRNDIYQQIKGELTNLNKLYSPQKYYVHDVSFISEVVPLAQPGVMMARMEKTSGSNLSVGDKLKLSATVVLASAPNQEVIKMVHN